MLKAFPVHDRGIVAIGAWPGRELTSCITPHSFKQEHIKSCKFARTPCPNKEYGCPELLLNSQLDEHLERECQFTPVQCPWCSKKVHNKDVSVINNNLLVSVSIPTVSFVLIASRQAGVWTCDSCLSKRMRREATQKGGKSNEYYKIHWNKN